MPIEGPIPDLGVSDLLQLLALSRRTGRLDATRPGDRGEYTLWLEEGQIVGQAGSEPDLWLGRIAILREGVSEDEVARGLARQRTMAGRRLGEILVEQDAISEAAVRDLVRFQVEEGLFRILRWTEGRLNFQEEAARPTGTLEVRFPTDSLLLDAVRRVDEWRMATGMTGDRDPIPRLVEQDPDSTTEVDLSPLEWETLAEIDGRRSLGAIARGLARFEVEVAHAVQSLVAARVVELTGATGPRADAEPPTGNGRRAPIPVDDYSLEDGTSAFAAGDVEEADRRADKLLARHPDSVPANVLKGMVMQRMGRSTEAIQYFDRAIELDPLHEPVYFHLASTLVRSGDLDRARGALDTFLALAAPDDPMRSRANALLAGVTQTLEALNGPA